MKLVKESSQVLFEIHPQSVFASFSLFLIFSIFYSAQETLKLLFYFAKSKKAEKMMLETCVSSNFV